MGKITVGCLLVGVSWVVATGCDDFAKVDLGAGGTSADAGPNSNGGNAGTHNGGSGNGNAGANNGGTNNAGSPNNAGNGGGGSGNLPPADAGGCEDAKDCNDIDNCTKDSCVDGLCVHEAKNIDDDNACTVDDCNPITGVVSHIPVADRDGDRCTLDACQEDSGVSDAGVLDPDDSNACTVDICDPAVGAVHTPLDPDDGDGCTTDQCIDPGPVTHTFCASNLCDIDTENCLTISGTSTFSQSSPIPINDNSNASSVVFVSGVGTVLRDINLQTFITHSCVSDLDIAIESPTGTVVTLSSNNTLCHSNVFNGTTWDDSAVTPATDASYTNGVTSSPLIAEEALGAFIGENPNGTWTLWVADEASGDTGSIASWSLSLNTISAAPTITVQTHTQSTSKPITDDNVVTTSTLNVPAVAADGTQLCSLTVNTAIAHTNPGDLDITLTSPTGTVVLLSSSNGGGFDDVFNGTVWNDDANPAGMVPYATNGLVTDHLYVGATAATPLVPEGALSTLIGENPVGTWTLSVTDKTNNALTGTITSWGLNVGRCFRAVPPS
jgi:subtilisin-like proprotein convertase family protein